MSSPSTWNTWPVLSEYLDAELGILKNGTDLLIYGDEKKPSASKKREQTLWKGRIKEIRKSPESSHPHFMIQWFYNKVHLLAWLHTCTIFTASQKTELRKAFMHRLGDWEIVFTDHEDIIEWSTIDGKARKIHTLKDTVDQEFIPDNSLYTRFHLLFKESERRKTLAVKGPIPSCVSSCMEHYHPDKDIQHFCRFCKRWFHLQCLQEIAEEVDDVEEALESVKGDLQGSDILKQQALLPIARGGDLREGIAGYVKHIYNAFLNAQTGKEKLPKLLTAKDINTYDWHHTHMYKCPRCENGFL